LTIPTVDTRLLARLLSGPDAGLDWESFSAEEWSQVVQLAEAEGVGPQLYWALSGSNKVELLPTSLQEHLRAMFVATRLNNEQILREFKLITTRFGQAGIPVVALKGICFALTIYPDIGMRPMADLDLLIPKSQLAEAVKITRELDYLEPVPEAFPGTRALLIHSVDLHKQTAPFIALEIHFSLVAEKSFSYAVPVDWFWTQTEPLRTAAEMPDPEQILMLTPTAQVLYACAHAMLKHGQRNTSLRWFYDIDRLVRVHADRINWELLLSQCMEFKWSSGVYAALSHVMASFDTPIPSHVLDALSQISDRNTELVLTFQQQPATHTLDEYQKFKTLDGKGRLKLILGLVVPGPEYMRWRYGSKNNRTLLYLYLYRWFSIVKDGIRTILYLMKQTDKQAKQPAGIE
jgi:hypothetical protein